MVSELASDDAEWAAGLMAERRREYERYSPVFWRPAAHARGLHVRFLRRQIMSPGTVALRTSRGFLIAQRRPAEVFVDDFAITADATWADDGAELLLAVWDRVATPVGQDGPLALRVVTARADHPKSALLADLGLQLAEQWWVRELAARIPARTIACRPRTSARADDGAGDGGAVSTDAPASGVTFPPRVGSSPWVGSSPSVQPASEVTPPERASRRIEASRRIDGPGFSGLFGPAPPVYDPGGPVLLADRVQDGADSAELEAEARRLGAVLLVVPAVPGTARARELSGRGWRVASDWYLGQPARDRR